MKFLLFFLFTVTTLFSYAEQIDKYPPHESESALSLKCMIMIPLMCLAALGVGYLLVTNKKRNDKGNQS